MNVHPVAALFPMMTDEELNDLAADIQANGLVHPIVVDAEGQLIDGRNRLEACRRAEVEPEFTTLNGQEPVAFILSCNVNRRHLNKGQQAMAVARSRSFNDRTMQDLAVTAGVAKGYVVQASVVLQFAPDLADAVLSASIPLNDAYAEACRRKKAAESDEAKFATLYAEAPDLATLVQEERISLSLALEALAERRKQEEQRRQDELEARRVLTTQLHRAVRTLDPVNIDPDDRARDFLARADGKLINEEPLSAERVRRALDVLARYLILLEGEEQVHAA